MGDAATERHWQVLKARAMSISTMTVTFCWHLDARQGPLLKSRFNAPLLGRMGLLALLELQLGLAGPPVARSRRVVAYLGNLRRVDEGSRFYSSSLAVDEMGVASELLGWRDEWLLHGWDGTAPPRAPPRIAEMALVEASGDRLPIGEAERLRRVHEALASRSTPIDEVILLDDLERLPSAWRAVLQCLPVRAGGALVASACDMSSALARLQAAVLEATTSGTAKPLADTANDGSVLVYRCENAETARHWLARREVAASLDQLVVCERAGLELDDVLRANGEPTCGFDRHSGFRPALQALPLALELLWKPGDAHRVLEFLGHPYGPFRRRARRTLARAYAAQPGCGSESWRDAMARIKELDGGDALATEVEFWFGQDQWPRDDGAPLDAVIERTQRVARSMRALLGLPRDDLKAIAGGVKQSEAMLDALNELKRQGLERLTPRHVEQLLDQVTSGGASNPYAEPQVGCRRSSTTSALAALEPAQEVVWWMPSRPLLPSPPPWSRSEIKALETAGTKLRDTAEELRALSRDWLRPLLTARKRFVLVLPPTTEEEHPIWLLVKRLMPSLPVQDIESELAACAHSEAVPDKPLPALKRYMNVAAEMNSRRGTQSFTSLADLFDSPAVAVLKDAAALRSATLLAVDDERRLMGTLAHRLVEGLFSEPNVLSWSEDQVRAWFDAHVDALVQAEGTPLLMLGQGVTLHRFQATAREGAVALLAHLQSAGAVEVKTEVEYRAELFGVPVVGKLDVWARLADGQTAVLDLKWSGENRYRERLETGTHLQLAIYSALVEAQTGHAPRELAYFIFESRSLLATSSRVFPNATDCAPPAGTSVVGLLAMAEASLRWRSEQLRDGVLELVDTRLADIGEFQGPEGTLPVREPGPWNSELVALLGWEEGA